MKSESFTDKNIFLKTIFEKSLKPKIHEKLDNGEIKVVLSVDYVKDTLGVDYEIGYLYTRLKETLLDTNLNISIRKLKKEFVFYEKSNNVNRECDTLRTIFKKSLEPKILKILSRKYSITFEEKFLKEYLNIEYSTDRIYKKLKDILMNTDISISVKKNVKIDNNKSNHFIFYKKGEILIEKQNICKETNSNEEIDLDKEDFKNYMEESVIENEKIKEEIHKKSLEDLAKTLNLDVDNYCECPNCENYIRHLSKKCDYCNTKLEWKCPTCGNIIEDFSKNCKYCDTEL